MNLFKRAYFTYQLRRRFYHWDRATLERHQVARVAAVLDFARRHSPFYAEQLGAGSTLAAAPVSDKSVMMTNFNSINTAGLDRDTLVDFKIARERDGEMGLFAGGYSIGLSSGTSGSRGLTVLSEEERALYGCLLLARSGLPRGIGPRRVLFTLRTNNASFMEPRSLGLKIVFADYTHTPEEIVKLLNAKRINVFAGPPSLLRLIAARVEHIATPLKAVISYAEVLDPATRAELETAFRAPVVQIYQGSEGFIACTCSHGNLHLNEDVILVEDSAVDEDDPEVREVSLTDLYRVTQPIIRYRLGDLLEFDPTPCPCGSCFRRVKVIHGRSDDIFLLPGQNGAPRHLFPDYVRRAINQASGDIVEYQAIQHAPDEIEIRLITLPGADRAAIEAKVLENLRWRAEVVGGVVDQVAFTDTPLERNPRSQKLIRVVRRF